MSFRPDPKPAARTVDPDAGMAKIEAEGRCRACQKPLLTVRQGAHPLVSLQRAHLVGRGVRGDDIDHNLIPLGAACHSIQHTRNAAANCHGVITSHEEVVREIRRSMRPEERQYVIAKKSRSWLEANYPSQPRAAGFFVDVADPNELDALYVMLDSARRDFQLPDYAPVKDVLAHVLHFALTAPKTRAA